MPKKNETKIPPLFYSDEDKTRTIFGIKITEMVENKKGQVTLKEYDPIKVIEKIIETIEPEVISLIERKEWGSFILSSNILLETMQRIGFSEELAKPMLTNPTMLYTYSLIATIGFLAGRAIPEELIVDGTKEKGSDVVLRVLLRDGGDIKEA